jgi:hypothetical protein
MPVEQHLGWRATPLQVETGAARTLYRKPDGEEEEERRELPTQTHRTFKLIWEEFDKLGEAPLSAPASPPSFALPPASQWPRPEQSEGVPDLPSRISLLRAGRLNLGLRLGFPAAKFQHLAGMPESVLKEAARWKSLLKHQITGEIPKGSDAVDKDKLARAIWGIFSTNIAPDVAKGITGKLSGATGPGGVSYQLDLVLSIDFSVGGLVFTVKY